MLTSSIMSYKDRGKWGNPRYRGNCSGWVIYNLLKHFQPKAFTEIFAGGGTGYEVAKELGYTSSIHLDLNPQFGGWNALTDDLPGGSDFTFLHPPYYNIIKYSGEMYGEPHLDDLSRCTSYADFLMKSNLVNAKAFSGLRNGGRMAVLVGDVRKDGQLYSLQKDMQWFGHIESIIIKEQHNCESDRRRYRGSFIPIEHEYLIIMKKANVWVVPIAISKKVMVDIRDSLKVTWRDLVQAALESIGGESSLETLYGVLEGSVKAKSNRHWREKIRQTLQIYRDFERVERGYWKLTSFDDGKACA